jgi:copper resistance protein D
MTIDRFLRLFDFFSVILRAATLTFQTLTIGGIAFLALVLKPSPSETQPIWGSGRRWVLRSAVALAVAQTVFLSTNLFILIATTGLSLGEALGANMVLAAALSIVASLAIAFLSSGERWQGSPWIFVPAGLLLVSSVITSHSMGRLDHRMPLALLTSLHQGATAVWIGGLPFLVFVLFRARDAGLMREASQRFSKVALASVSALAAAGLALGVVYTGSWSGLYGTAYGAMVTGKVVLFGSLLVLGAINFLNVRATQVDDAACMTRVRCFGEAEIGIGITVLLAAASLTSQPPAVDLTVGRLTGAEIAARMTPKWPRFTTPSVKELPETVLAAQPGISPAVSAVSAATAAKIAEEQDIAWSEYNHHWAGLVVLAMGLLAFLARTNHFPMARNWPLIFIGLAVFLFFRADPEAWPLGPRGFWQSWLNPEDLQHRLFVVLIVAFAIFEWKVQTRRVTLPGPALVFPAVCVLAGAALLTHSHSLANIKEELLAEYSHLPIAVAGVLAGWSRWLEIRLPAGDRAKPVLSWIWPVCFILVGAILLNYREA